MSIARARSVGLITFAVVMAVAGATQFTVGGPKGWAVPDSSAMSYDQWASKNSFQIGDSLLFVYPAATDSVLLVDQDAYNACNTSIHIRRFADGDTLFFFARSGTFYFISGVEANCKKGEKLQVVVQAAGNSSGSPAPAQPPSSPPPASNSPSPAPPSPSPRPPPATRPSPQPSPTISTPGAPPPPPSSSPSRPTPPTPSTPAPSQQPQPRAKAPIASSPPPTPPSPPPPPPEHNAAVGVTVRLVIRIVSAILILLAL